MLILDQVEAIIEEMEGKEMIIVERMGIGKKIK